MIDKKEVTFRVVAAFEELLALKKAKNISEICRKVDYQRSNYNQMEIGERPAPLNLVFGLIIQYDINPYWIINGDSPILLQNKVEDKSASSLYEKVRLLEHLNQSLLETIDVQKQLITELRKG